MKRYQITPRKYWQGIVEAQGFSFHTRDNGPYWDESVCYELSARDLEAIETTTEELQALCLKAAQFIIDEELFSELRISEAAIPLIRSSWERETASVYGRFDLAYDGISAPKLLEYNAQTPTSLLEAAEIQWYWKEAVRRGKDQFNSIEPKLRSQWKACNGYIDKNVYFSSLDNEEDRATVDYLAAIAKGEGFLTSYIDIEELGWLNGQFVDLNNQTVKTIFALYPWEWLISEQADKITASFESTVWMEPAWKMLWSNKAILAILWKLFPGHPNLLEAHVGGPDSLTSWVEKPIYSREGSNITIREYGVTTNKTEGLYGKEGFVFQDVATTSCIDGNYAVIGSWYVTDQGAAGVGIRESSGPITDRTARFVPHYLA
jgi:glutathionylspermidine synthase